MLRTPEGQPRLALAISSAGGGAARARGGGKPRLAVTMGDPAGIGPEVVLKAAATDAVRESLDVQVVGSRSALDAWAARLSLPVRDAIVDLGSVEADPGRPTSAGARAAVDAIVAAARMCERGGVDAMVTGPVSKAAIAAAGYDFSGHTEFLAELCGAADVLMSFVCGNRRVGLATTHVPLSEVSGAITRELVFSKLRVLARGLTERLGVRDPRIAVTGLNPHAGESGRLGVEDERIIAPAVAMAREQGLRAEGPFPADAIFRGLGKAVGAGPGSGFDAVLAMYHDQGAIPAKLWGPGVVNLTLGLPIVRTSVDHGTAFELAGKGAADPSSMEAAMLVAGEIVRRAGVSS